MIQTLSLCNHCYRKIPAFIFPRGKEAWMKKTCDVHGDFESLVEKSWSHFSAFYRYGTMGNNNAIIVHIHDKCNMKCKWCYYGGDKIHDQQFLDQFLYEPYRGMQPGRPFSLMFSGGEPTERPDYHEFVEAAYNRGWMPSTITNMINLADEEFFFSTLADPWADNNNNYRFAMSFQHPKNYSKEIYEKKIKALENIAREGLRASCVMFSVQSLDELDFIKEFYDEWRGQFSMLRIRTMFHTWKNKGSQQIFQSELYEAFMDHFGEKYTPVQSSEVEQSTSYGMYMKTCERRDVSLMSAPTVENIDYHLASRPVYMLNDTDYRCYPVPIAQIVQQGISDGWKDGYKIS